MRKKICMLMFVLIIAGLAACSNGNENEEEQESEELKALEVEFEVPEKADVDETVELKAIVTYGDEEVNDADEVEFEYWKQGNEEDSTTIESKNNEDGTYTAEVSFDSDGIYEMYAHTTARDLHTMPKKSITVGNGEASHDHDTESHEHESEEHDHGDHAEGFELHFVEPENVTTNSETELMIHVQMDGSPLEEANVRYEMWSDAASDEHVWVDAEETVAGEYTATHQFIEAGTYHVTIHVENDEGLHEHKEYELLVNN